MVTHTVCTDKNNGEEKQIRLYNMGWSCPRKQNSEYLFREKKSFGLFIYFRKVYFLKQNEDFEAVTI